MASPQFTEDGLGTLKLGMPAQQAADLGWIERGSTPCNGGWQTARYRKGLYVGVWNDKVEVIAATSRRLVTSEGVRPGDSLKRLKSTYRVKKVSKNIYDNSPIYGAKGAQLFFPVRKGTVHSLELAHGFVPDGTEFEC
jgi:hypothetical protein